MRSWVIDMQKNLDIDLKASPAMFKGRKMFYKIL